MKIETWSSISSDSKSRNYHLLNRCIQTQEHRLLDEEQIYIPRTNILLNETKVKNTQYLVLRWDKDSLYTSITPSNAVFHTNFYVLHFNRQLQLVVLNIFQHRKKVRPINFTLPICTLQLIGKFIDFLVQVILPKISRVKKKSERNRACPNMYVNEGLSSQHSLSNDET